MKTIQELTTTIEELEKRIKAISSGQSTLTQLIAIRDYLNDVQTYLNELNETFDTHINTCTDYSGDINTIKEQISKINSTLEGMDNVNNQQVTEITKQLNETTNKINNFLGESTTSLTAIENDITSLQTDLANTQDDLETTQNDISSINTLLGEHTTTLTNLQTAQTNLSTTQSNQASSINTNTNNISTNSSKISALTSRMTTAESNISALTGGVDLGGLESKVDSIPETYFSHVDLTMHLVVNNSTDKSRFYNYKVDLCDVVYEKFKLNYTTESTENMTINYYRNSELIKTLQVDLSLNPTSFEFDCINYPEERYNIYQFEITSTSKVVFTGLQTTIFGKNAQVFENDKDLKVEIYDNNYYVTKYENETITYEKILAGNPLKIENLAYDMNDLKYKKPLNNRAGGFGPSLSEGYELAVRGKDVVIRESTANVNYYAYQTDFLVPDTENYFTYNSTNVENSCVITLGGTTDGASGFINNNRQPGLYYLASPASLSFDIFKLNEFLNGEFYFVSTARYNNYISNQTKIYSLSNIVFIAAFEDGYLYLIYGRRCEGVSKIAKYGQFATAYIQEDGSVNVYINRGYTTHKYNLTNLSKFNYKTTFVETITDCDCFYELNNNQILKHTKKGWVVENTNQDTTTEETTGE